MGSISKSFSLLLILILVFPSLFMVKPAFAQNPTPSVPLPMPSVPEFTVQLIGPPIVVNTTYSLDPNTGKVVAQIGYTNEYSAVNLTIKNQPFTPYNDASIGQFISLYYNAQYKLHNETDDWRSLYSINYVIPTQSNSDYTILTISLYTGVGNPSFGQIPVGAKIDLQVDATIGYETRGQAFGSYYLAGETSVWSSTQTINIPANTPLSPTPAPSSSPPTSTSVSSSSYASLLLITTVAFVVIVFLLVVIISLLLYMRKCKK